MLLSLMLLLNNANGVVVLFEHFVVVFFIRVTGGVA